MALPTLANGALFASRWIVGRVLGKSELAVIYEAEESRRDRFLALKLLDKVHVSDPGAWARFQALGGALGSVKSEGIARSQDVGIHEGQPYVTSERILFPTLARYATERGPTTPEALAQALSTLGRALDSAHAAGVAHGDLKPQNVFVAPEHPGWARISDFGLSELRAGIGLPVPRTLGYGAPELGREPPSPASDRYSLALLSFFALTGVPWFSAQRVATTLGGTPISSRARLASERARELGSVLDRRFDAWFTRGMSRIPAERFASGEEMARLFAELLHVSAPVPESLAQPLSETVPVPQQQQLFEEARKKVLELANADTAPVAQVPLKTPEPRDARSVSQAPPASRANDDSTLGLPRQLIVVMAAAGLAGLVALGILAWLLVR